MRGAAKHDSRGIVAMANKGAGTNTSVCRFTFVFCFTDDCCYRSQFYVTFKATPNLDNKHTVFGKLVGGDDVLNALEKLPRKDGTERPAKPVRITEVIMCVHSFFAQTYILYLLF
jgi:peptidyl-prolyl cis-trans isomerase-like protein 2